MWTTRRRSCARTTKTNKALNITVGTTKKSTATRLPRWLSRKVLQVCDGGLRWRTRYLDTVACEIDPRFLEFPVNPRRAPEGIRVGHPSDERSDLRGDGRAACPFRRLFQVQKSLKPVRCHRITVAG
jgi:hypothetical protein